MKNGPYIQTFTGRRVYLFDLTPDQFCIEDIAHALSNQCRFTGHCSRFYSVAEHSCFVAQRAIEIHYIWAEDETYSEQEGLASPNEVGLAALLHDASEAYMMDLAQPWKRSPEFSFFKKAETMVMSKVYERFELNPAALPATRAADRELLTAESLLFWPEQAKEWSTYSEDHKWRLPRGCCASPKIAKRLFLEAFAAYGGKE